KDIATVTLDLSWTTNDPEFYLNETASNSTGFYIGSFDLDSIPLYGFPNPQPPVNSGKITFLANQNSTRAATLTISFPELVAGQTQVESLTGTVTANGATDVRVDTSITTAFSHSLADAGDTNSFKVASGSTAISGTRSLSADGKKLIFNPDAQLPYSSKITVSAPYSASGLQSPQGNPVYRDFSYSFDTQNSNTQPSAINQVNLFADSSYSAGSAYATNDDFPGSGIIYIEFRGTDASANTIDQTIADSTIGDSVILTETGPGTGVFRGSLDYTSLPDDFVLTISARQQPSASQTLNLTYPELSQLTPASGSTDISISTPIYISVNESLDQTTLTTDKIKLSAADNTEADCDIVWNTDLKQIELTPNNSLSYATDYFVKIANLSDLAGNLMENNFVSTFKTQATSIEPTNINSLKAFSDSGYTSQIPDNGIQPPGSTCYFELTAVDNSSSSIDSTNLRMTSDISATTDQIKLVETGKNTGVFTGSKKLFDEENATLTINSEADSSYSTRIRTLGYPTYTSLQPASGSTGIYLDTRFIIKAGKPFDAATISTHTILLSDSTGIVSFTPVISAADEITIYSQLSKNSPVTLNLKDTVKDTDGMNFPYMIAEFQSINPIYTDLRLFEDAARTNLINSDSEVEVGQTIYARVTGTDAYYHKNETVHLSVSTINATNTIDLVENSAGIFEGSFLIPDEPEQEMDLTLVENPDLKQQLYIMPAFSLISFSPASGAVSVAADSWPTWNFTRSVNSTYANSNYFNVTKVSDGAPVNGIFTQSPTRKQVRFQPDSLFELLTEYEMTVFSTIEDESGNKLGTKLTTRFTTQPPPPPPSIISSFANYETNAYATSTNAVAKNGTLYLKMVADDVSFSTYETARVRVDSSDGTYDGEELTMVEVSPPSGVFSLELAINLPLGTQITITPQVAPNRAITVTAFNRTRLLDVNPASGSADLYLDQPLRLDFSQAINSNTIASGLVIISEDIPSIKFIDTTSNSGKTIEISPSNGYATGSSHILSISTSLKDANGLFLLPEKIAFSTLGESEAELEIKTGLPPLDNQPVSQTGEIIPGANLVVATTTNLFSTKPEYRTLKINSDSQNIELKLIEKAPGFFIATFTPETDFSESGITAQLDFGTKPELSFNLATLPVLLSTYPQENASEIEEYPILTASFSRLMSKKTGSTGASLIVPSGTIGTVLLNASDSTQLSWQPTQTLPLQASCSLRLTNLTDYLGQPFNDTQLDFSTGGLQGINLYKDNSFSLRIASETIEASIAYVEVAASSTLAPDLNEFYLHARTGSKASATYRLPLQRLASDSGRFRCSLELSSVKNQPQYQIPMLPGEWLELSSPELTDNRKIFYFRHSGAASPKDIKDIKFYSEKHYSQPVNDILAVPSLFIEIEAEDLNWFTSDSTFVKVTSDADSTGFNLELKEAGTHSGLFRGAIKIDNTSSHISTSRLLVQPDQRIFVQSLTDSSVEKWVKYLPTNGLRMVSVFPNPVRGNFMYFRYYLNFPGIVEIEIYDTSGHQISSRFIRGFQGENKYKWRLPGNLANGVYFYVIKLDDSSPHPDTKRKAKGKFAVLR
ncbi:MAG: Ig-like domain-containing protein, partial [Candidatus Rifleibacteriota bacterium]